MFAGGVALLTYDSEGAAFIVGVFLRRDNVGWGRECYLSVDDGNDCCFKRLYGDEVHDFCHDEEMNSGLDRKKKAAFSWRIGTEL